MPWAFSRSFAAALILGCAFGLVSSEASACDPAPDHSVAIVSEDAPECLMIFDGFAYGRGELTIINECEEAAVVAPIQCEGCEAMLEVQPGAQGQMVIESRALSDGETSAQTLSWSMGSESGTVRTEVTFQDNSHACDDWGHGGGGLAGGCRVSGDSRGSLPWSGLVLFLFAARRRFP